MSPAILNILLLLNILPHFSSLRHIAVHASNPLALWYWCNMLIQLLSFKYDVCHKEFEPKSVAASWNATSSCLLSSHLSTPRCQLHMRIASFYELLKIPLALHRRPLHTLLELLLNIKGPCDLNYIQSQSYSYALWSGIWEWSLACLTFEVAVEECCDAITNDEKKRISTLNFETSSHRNVTAKKPIGNMYFMYVNMAWFQSLSRLEHDMLHSTVWPMHKICSMPVCWRPNLTRMKRMLFLPIILRMLSLIQADKLHRSITFFYHQGNSTKVKGQGYLMMLYYIILCDNELLYPFSKCWF